MVHWQGIPKMTDEEDRPDADEPPTREPERIVRAEELFGETRQLWIEHNGERYRLRITRRNKLILQK